MHSSTFASRSYGAAAGCAQWSQSSIQRHIRAQQASPWNNTDLNKKLISYANETFFAPLSLVQELSQAKNMEDAVKIQIEFVKAQTDSFNERAKELGEIYTKVATAATKTPVGMST